MAADSPRELAGASTKAGDACEGAELPGPVEVGVPTREALRRTPGGAGAAGVPCCPASLAPSPEEGVGGGGLAGESALRARR
ncbi:hypothetical protein PF005_g26176 [Phytophthora fragariae]|uniref:Uncharacterized protein n=1 Tax=Phytophthora fragariae TaxID=53985 RepID=A0A6A3DDI3_9STRA|nr:hypothetical protein PF003_g11663 [Phytophthora fragariae]KAE8919784.1 hypothetical protein PF009_g29915 [Phytophthora fragariae]KAE9071515.1 hypothetical protein PF010_g25847 [Phytophthora fragariae]KAE9071754.1 hypothetical protein PF007_g26438 [Phytophthora fragariae]KAE9087243.1 hypothetical protein PF006_g25847 [Phytophthora fragariae]